MAKKHQTDNPLFRALIKKYESDDSTRNCYSYDLL